MKKINVSNYKKTLSKFVTGITVICVKTDNKIIGKTVNSFNSLSLNPPLILFSLGNYSSDLNFFLNTRYLSINILSKKQKKISEQFAKNNPNPKGIDFKYGKNDTALIPNCVANLECRLKDKIKNGDHTIFICKVLNVDFYEKIKPLWYFNSKYF